MVINVDESIRGSFLPLIPEILHGYIESGEAFCLGYMGTGLVVHFFLVVLIDLFWTTNPVP